MRHWDAFSPNTKHARIHWLQPRPKWLLVGADFWRLAARRRPWGQACAKDVIPKWEDVPTHPVWSKYDAFLGPMPINAFPCDSFHNNSKSQGPTEWKCFWACSWRSGWWKLPRPKPCRLLEVKGSGYGISASVEAQSMVLPTTSRCLGHGWDDAAKTYFPWEALWSCQRNERCGLEVWKVDHCWSESCIRSLTPRLPKPTRIWRCPMFAMNEDETAVAAQMVAATPHCLESWGDVQNPKGSFWTGNPPSDLCSIRVNFKNACWNGRITTLRITIT